jgi:hypothetical protein
MGHRYCPTHGWDMCTCWVTARAALPTLGDEEVVATPLPSPPPTVPHGAPDGAELEAVLAVGAARAALRAALDALLEGRPVAAERILKEALAP